MQRKQRVGTATFAAACALAVTACAGSGDADRVATISDVITPESTTTTTGPVFVSVSTSSTPPTTSARTTTTTTSTTSSTTTTSTSPASTTTAPPETLPAQPPTRPIAPPPDPRGAEEQIQLGGISIPSLGLDAPLLEGIRLTTLDNGPGHWPGTAMPGEVGNVVVAAHRTSHGAPFRNIDQLVAGDIVEFSTDAGLIEYTVTGTQIVQPDAIWIIDPTDTPTATLFACHPPGSISQRIVVNLVLS